MDLGQQLQRRAWNGTTTYILEPKKVEGLEDIVAIDAGIGHTVALKADGTVWVWVKQLWSAGKRHNHEKHCSDTGGRT